MATRFMYKALSTTTLGIALSLLLAATTTTSAASSNTAGALRLDQPENPYAGSWSGTFAYTYDDGPGSSGSGAGTIDLTISDLGRLTGTFLNDDPEHGGGPVVGHVAADGTLMLVFFHYHNGGYPFRGTVTINNAEQLVGTYDNVWVGGSVVEVATLERNP